MANFVRAIVPLTISARLALLLGVLALVAAVGYTTMRWRGLPSQLPTETLPSLSIPAIELE